MDPKKPSTSDILAKIRAQKAAAAASTPPASAALPAAEQVASEAVVESPKPAAPQSKPGSTKDILAAIRAKGAGTPTATPPAAVAAESRSAPDAPASKPTLPRPSVQDMLKAVREGKVAAPTGSPAPAGAVAAAKPPVVAPPMPAKPASAKKAEAPRRGFLATCLATLLYPISSSFRFAWTSMATVTGVATLGTARFMFPNVLVEPPSKFKVGPISDYPLNSVSNKWKDQFGIWIVHTDQYEGRNLIFALASVCTHLGCTPSWLDGEQKFKCPCHGSGFYMTGVNFEGPAPRPLERVGIRIAEGMLEVDKSVKFQEEMGQWYDAASFVELA